MDHLKSFNDVLPLIAEILDFTAEGHLSVDVCFDKLKKHILLPLEGIRKLAAAIDTDSPAGLENFDSLVAVGPGGIGTVLPAFSAVYVGLADLRGRLKFSVDARTVEREIGEMSQSLLTCLHHLRHKNFRGLYDPKGGFRELASILHSAAADRILPVSSIPFGGAPLMSRALVWHFRFDNDPRPQRHQPQIRLTFDASIFV